MEKFYAENNFNKASENGSESLELFEDINEETRAFREEFEKGWLYYGSESGSENEITKLFEDISKQTEELKEECEEEREGKMLYEKHTPLQANCELEMHIGSENKVIYVRPGKTQYFLATSLKGCGQISVKYIGLNYNQKSSKICGNLGNYYILSAGILLVPKKHLKPGAIDILPLVASDGCNYYKFEAVFDYDPCRFRNK